MEVAGVALGGVSLVISALENYRTCARFFDDYANYEVLLNRKKNYLWLQKEQLDVTLTSIGIDTNSSQSTPQHLPVEALRAHLHGLYPHDAEKAVRFVEIIEHMNEISLLAASRLNGGSSSQSRWPSERTMALKRRMRKIRLSLDGEKGELTSLLNELQMWNSSLKHCFERTEIPPMESIRDRAVAALHTQYDARTCETATADARILHEALTEHWNCGCPVPHTGSLRLKWHTSKPSVNTQYEIAVSMEETSGGASVVNWKALGMTVAADLRTSQAAPDTDKNAPAAAPKGAKPAKTPKRVRIHEFLPSWTTQRSNQSAAQSACSPTPATTCANTTQSQTSPSTTRITTLCSSIIGCDGSKKDLGHLAYTKDSSTVQVSVQNVPTKRASLCMSPIRTNQHRVSGLNLALKQRLEIGAALCWAVLLLSDTQWLSADLTQEEVQLLLDTINPHQRDSWQGTYVSFRDGVPQTSTASLPTTLASDSTLSAFIRNKTLFTLGVMLIELCLGRSFENLHADSSMLIGTRFQNAAASFGVYEFLSILVDRVQLEVGEQYADAVRRCLRCPFDGRDDEQDLKQPQFKRNFFLGIVAPVQATYDRLTAR